MEHGGDDEEGAEPHPVHPCCDLLPAVVREPMEEGAAHDGRDNQELPEQKAIVRSLRGATHRAAPAGREPSPSQRVLSFSFKLTHQHQKFIDVSGIG